MRIRGDKAISSPEARLRVPGSARGPLAVLGGPPNTPTCVALGNIVARKAGCMGRDFFDAFFRTAPSSSVRGGPPQTARGPRALPRAAAFTLLEMLAAMVFLAILIPAIVGALSISNRTSEITDRRATAAELAENKLDEQLAGNVWQSSATDKGDFGADYPGYRWELSQGTWQGDTTNTNNNMTELAVEVFFPVQGKEQSVKLTTLVSANNAQYQPQSQDIMEAAPQ
jgi:type II secretory pathway pseudopilin PulG